MDQAAADELVHRFAAYGQAPIPSDLRRLLADDVRLVTPRMPNTDGLVAFDVGDDGLASKRVSCFDPTAIVDAASGSVV